MTRLDYQRHSQIDVTDFAGEKSMSHSFDKAGIVKMGAMLANASRIVEDGASDDEVSSSDSSDEDEEGKSVVSEEEETKGGDGEGVRKPKKKPPIKTPNDAPKHSVVIEDKVRATGTGNCRNCSDVGCTTSDGLPISTFHRPSHTAAHPRDRRQQGE